MEGGFDGLPDGSFPLGNALYDELYDPRDQ
jgi:hypothetical protein